MVLYRHSALAAYRPPWPPISLFFDIAQGAGLAGATGIRPFLPPLAAGAAARADAGLDFEGSGYAFLESPAFLAAVLALAVLFYALERARARDERRLAGIARPTRDPLTLALGALALALGALLFAGSLEAGGEDPWPGIPAGAACAALAFIAAGGLMVRAGRRVDAQAGPLLAVWADAASLALAAVAIAFPPASLVALVALAYLVVAARRDGGRKYEGLRILR